MATPTARRNSKEMRVRKVPIKIHRAIVTHQGMLAQMGEKDISLDEAAIDLWQKAISIIPALNQ